MKNKYSIIRFILATLTTILAISVLIGYSDNKVIMPCMLTCLGIIQVFDGLHFYKNNKKSTRVMLILSGILLFGVVIFEVVNVNILALY